jgi:hypothetical protein
MIGHALFNDDLPDLNLLLVPGGAVVLMASNAFIDDYVTAAYPRLKNFIATCTRSFPLLARIFLMLVALQRRKVRVAV